MAYDLPLTILQGANEEDRYESECETTAGHGNSLQTLHKWRLDSNTLTSLFMPVISHNTELESNLILELKLLKT